MTVSMIGPHAAGGLLNVAWQPLRYITHSSDTACTCQRAAMNMQNSSMLECLEHVHDSGHMQVNRGADTSNSSTHLQAQDAGAGGHKVASVVVGVEADEVCFEHSPQQFLPDGQGAVHLAAGEGGVQEPAYLHTPGKHISSMK